MEKEKVLQLAGEARMNAGLIKDKEVGNRPTVWTYAFADALQAMNALHMAKNTDYGDSFHKTFEEFGAIAGTIRLNDKMNRVKALVKNGKAEVKDESLKDTLLDMANYAVMLYVELQNQGDVQK